jgi:hypothetical protein
VEQNSQSPSTFDKCSEIINVLIMFIISDESAEQLCHAWICLSSLINAFSDEGLIHFVENEPQIFNAILSAKSKSFNLSNVICVINRLLKLNLYNVPLNAQKEMIEEVIQNPSFLESDLDLSFDWIKNNFTYISLNDNAESDWSSLFFMKLLHYCKIWSNELALKKCSQYCLIYLLGKTNFLLNKSSIEQCLILLMKYIEVDHPAQSVMMNAIHEIITSDVGMFFNIFLPYII